MMRHVAICMLCGTLAFSQATKSTSSPLASSSGTEAVMNVDKGSLPDAGIGPDVPVISVHGLCEDSHREPVGKNCVTIITRAQFHKLVADIQPNMPLSAQRQFATRYVEILIMAQKAHQMGMDQGTEFEAHMEIARVSILSEALSDALRERAHISDKEIADFYHQHLENYQKANLQRMYIPRIQQLPSPTEKLTEEQQRDRTHESENTMRAVAEKLHARAEAGENFNDLQDEALNLAGIHAGHSDTSLGETRRSQLPPKQAFVMDLKPGEVSAVIPDVSGYVIYRVESNSTEPLSDVQNDIRSALTAERVQEQLKAFLEAANPLLEERYFGPEKP